MHTPWQPVTDLTRSAHAWHLTVNQDSWLNYTQNTQWFSVLHTGPTRTITAGQHQGNDFPGAYYYDALSRQEFFLWATGATDWRRHRYEVRVADGHTHFGLYAVDGAALPAGVQLAALRRPATQVPDSWQALRIAIATAQAHWPLPPVSGPAPDWSALAQQTLRDLQRPDCHLEHAGEKGYNAYVRTGKGRGVPQPALELFVQTDIALSLARYGQATGHAAASAEARRLLPVLARFHNRDLHLLENNLPFASFATMEISGPQWPPVAPGRAPRRVLNSWYQFHTLHKVLEIAHRTGDATLRAAGLDTLGSAQRLMAAQAHLPPLFCDWVDYSACGTGLDVYAGGIYALCQVWAARLEPAARAQHWEEAIRTFTIMRRPPPGVYVHEPIALANAVAAAHALATEAGHAPAAQWRDDFMALLLMMLYQRAPHIGLFQACGGLLYPAFKESVECLWPLVELRAELPAAFPVRAVIAHQLRANLLHFDDQEPRGIPYEDLPTTELPGEKGSLGKEVYGAGQVFDLALMQQMVAGEIA